VLTLAWPRDVLAVPLVQRFIGVPMLYWSQFPCSLMLMVAALPQNNASFTVFRALKVFVEIASQVRD